MGHWLTDWWLIVEMHTLSVERWLLIGGWLGCGSLVAGWVDFWKFIWLVGWLVGWIVLGGSLVLHCR